MAVKNHNDKTCFLIHMSVPSNSNVSLKIFEKLRKYKDLEIEFSKVWHLKITTLPVVMGALSMRANPHFSTSRHFVFIKNSFLSH